LSGAVEVPSVVVPAGVEGCGSVVRSEGEGVVRETTRRSGAIKQRTMRPKATSKSNGTHRYRMRTKIPYRTPSGKREAMCFLMAERTELL
jgi:hypothetical protein